MVSDYRYHQLNIVRDYLSMAIYPIQWIVDSPVRLSDTLKQYTHSYHELVKINQDLREQQLLQSARTEKYMALEAENIRLRSLLQSSPRNGETLLVAEIIRVDSDPLIHRVILDKGSRQGVRLGQPVIDAEGIIGEVIEVHPYVSRVILLTDTSYGIPVENVRNGVRGIAVGIGAIKNLELQHVPNTVDLKVGDNLVTSGLDGRYPPGYPVGTVSEIQQNSGEPFVKVQITPSAHLERIRQVLLVQSANESLVIPPMAETSDKKNISEGTSDEISKKATKLPKELKDVPKDISSDVPKDTPKNNTKKSHKGKDKDRERDGDRDRGWD